MLKSDPDQGLQNAPRLNDGSLPHDVVDAAEALSRNDVRFDLEGLDDRSGAAVCVPYELFMRLKEMYYKLAMRKCNSVGIDVRRTSLPSC